MWFVLLYSQLIVIFLILSYLADGRLRQSSLIQMIADSGKSSSEDSGLALNGFITSLFVALNERTRERFIIGGADDGSVGFWTLEYVSDTFESKFAHYHIHQPS